ncbi:glycosyltransferase [uncultured Albimonas sp.]|uniref:glycosyltransferase family 2 protein n=1 Tax=uncultured Albimonas sp. TaxID=1331701 RepID=UPI0030EBB835
MPDPQDASLSDPLSRAVPDPGAVAVSVVCAWYNRAEFLRDSIDSLLAQQGVEDFEVVVANDGSPDPRVREILDSWDDPRLRVIHRENGGFVNAIRTAIDSSRGRYVAIMGAGDVCRPDRLARQKAHLDANPDLIMTGCWYEDRQQDASGVWQVATTHRNPAPAGPRDLHVRNPYTQGETMFRREAYDAVGGYRTFFKNSQDADLWLRLIETGRLGQLEEVLYERRIFADGITGNVDKMLRQSFYSSMAIEMSKLRLAGRPDLVELFGDDARWMRPRTTRSARRFLIAGLVHRHQGNLDRSALMMELSAREHPLYAVIVRALRLALSAPPATGLPALAMRAARRLSPAVGRFTVSR